ncbi:MAG UNVERIFIED_CONTAM: GntR family transcriptional regulator [Thermobifida fusca]
MTRYREIADAIRKKIELGEYARGSVLPSNADLAAEHAVSTPVVNRALQVLQSEGLVRAERGRGTVVHEIAPLVRRAVERHRRTVREQGGAFASEVLRLGHTPRSDLVRVGPTTPPPHVAALLELTGPDPVTAIRDRRMYADSTPVQLATSYVPWELATGTRITQPDVGPGGTYARLAEQGHAVVRWRERVTTRPPSETEGEFLQLTDDQRVLAIERVAYTAQGRPVEVTVMALPAHQWTLEYEWEDES